MPSFFRRAYWLILPLAAASAVLGGLAIARGRMRVAFEQRCGRVVGGSCAVGSIRIARDGVIAGGIEIRPAIRSMTLSVGLVAIRIDWWRALTGQPQSVGVQARDAVLTVDTPVQEFERAVRQWRDSHGQMQAQASAVGRFIVDEVSIESAAGTVRIGADLRAHVDGASASWRRGGDVEAHWQNAQLDVGDLTRVASGSCAVRNDPDVGQVTIDCQGFASQIDVRSVEDRVDAVVTLGRAVLSAIGGSERHASAAARGVADASTDARSHGVATQRGAVRVRARGGSVLLVRGSDRVVELHPAGFQLELEHGAVRSVNARLGADGGGPALEVDLAIHADRTWRFDVHADDVPLRELARWVPAVPWHAVDVGRASLRIRAEPTTEPGVAQLDGEAAIEDFGLQHPALAREPIDGLSISVRGAARADLVRRRLSSEGLQVALNNLPLALAGWVERDRTDETALDVSVRVPILSCDAIRRALPRPVVGPIDGLTFAGTIASDAHLALDTRRLFATELQIQVEDRCVVSRDALVQGIHRLHAPFVQRVQEPQGLRAFVTGPGSAAWVSLANVSPFVPAAVLSREDGRFSRHHGFDVNEIRAAIIRNIGAHRFVYGASTLSMQLAKNIFLAREKTLVRKLQEVVFTWYLERTLDKDSIVELYLNVVEFGPGIYGIGPASRFFFGREPRDLTPLQAIYLATLLPNPVARFANYQRGAVTPDTLARLHLHARRMAQSGALSPSELAFAENEALVFRPPTTPVHGSLTQSVDPATTDDAAQSMAPAANTTDVAPPVGSDTDTEPEHDDGEAEPLPPVSLRTGGTI